MAKSKRYDDDEYEDDEYDDEEDERDREDYEPHQGTMVLIFGILGLFCCMVFGIVAWVMGSSQIKGMDEGRIDPAGRSTANAGKILGMISVGLTVVGIIFYGVVIAIMVQNGQFPPNPNNGFNQNGFPNNNFPNNNFPQNNFPQNNFPQNNNVPVNPPKIKGPKIALPNGKAPADKNQDDKVPDKDKPKDDI